MIILRSKWFSPKEKTDEETEFQKSIRRRGSVGTGVLSALPVLVGGSIVGESVIGEKEDKAREKVDSLFDKHKEPIYNRYNSIDKKIKDKSDEIQQYIKNKWDKVRNNPRANLRDRINANIGEFEDSSNLSTAESKLHARNSKERNKAIDNLFLASKRLLNRVDRKAAKARLKGAAGVLALGTGVGIAAGKIANKSIKERNKKINRIRRHIED